MKKLRALRILPPLAIGRLGSAETPQENFTVVVDPAHPLGFRRITPQETLVVDERTGEILPPADPAGAVTFKEVHQTQGGDGPTHHIRPVAPFLEVWALVEGETALRPLTMTLLAECGASAADISWTVHVANRKVERRTDDPHDRVEASIGPFSDHVSHPLDGRCENFLPRKTIAFGHVRYITPNLQYPEIRLRFTPGKGLIYGPKSPADEKAGRRGKSTTLIQPAPEPPHYQVPPQQQVYDGKKGKWVGFEIPRQVRDGDPSFKEFFNETQPPALFAIVPPGPCWLNNNIAVSRGYLDDACDGTVEVTLAPPRGPTLTAVGRIVSAPPAVVPDALFVRTLADDLDQVIWGPKVPADEPPALTRARAEDILRRAFETVRFLNVAVMNGNRVDGRDPLEIDSMPAEEAYGNYRMLRPVFPPHTVDTLSIMALHQNVYMALRAGAAPWFPSLLRQPKQVGDFTDSGRRKMPAMMCGADGNYLALTYRQIDTFFRAAKRGISPPDTMKTLEADPEATSFADDKQSLVPRNAAATAHPARRAAELHHVAKGNPVSSRPVISVGNCTPGLEVDFRAVWRRVFEGIVLREYDNLVINIEPGFNKKYGKLKLHRLLRVAYESKGGLPREFVTMTRQIGPNPHDPVTESAVLSWDGNPLGHAPLEWSNLLADMLHERAGGTVTCFFTAEPSPLEMPGWDEDEKHIEVTMKVRPFFEADTAMISRELAQPGELTQGLCSPWQNDYRECSCYYWASARPDFINVEASATGASVGDNWLQKKHDGSYVPDDYADDRLVMYDDLFHDWEKWLRFAIQGKDAADESKE